MKRAKWTTLISVILAVLFMGTVVPAQDDAPSSALEVSEFVFCEAVEDHEPVAPAQSFPASIERVCLWTLIAGPENQESEITHVWYRGDTKVAEVPLKIRYSRTRTWSSKRMLPSWAGPWHVDVVDEQGTVLGSYAFTLTE